MYTDLIHNILCSEYSSRSNGFSTAMKGRILSHKMSPESFITKYHFSRMEKMGAPQGRMGGQEDGQGTTRNSCHLCFPSKVSISPARRILMNLSVTKNSVWSPTLHLLDHCINYVVCLHIKTLVKFPEKLCLHAMATSRQPLWTPLERYNE